MVLVQEYGAASVLTAGMQQQVYGILLAISTRSSSDETLLMPRLLGVARFFWESAFGSG
jgi:hypothetical protein